MAPRRVPPDQDRLVLSQSMLMPVSIVGGAILMAFSLGIFVSQIKAELQAIRQVQAKQWSVDDMRRYNYELSGEGLKKPDVDLISRRQ